MSAAAAAPEALQPPHITAVAMETAGKLPATTSSERTARGEKL